MMPERYIAFGDRTENGYFSFEPDTNNHGATIHVNTKSNGKKIFSLMPKIACMLADQHPVSRGDVYKRLKSSIKDYDKGKSGYYKL